MGKGFVTQNVDSTGATILGQDVLKESTTQAHPLGTRVALTDGRVFRYCQNGEVALNRGHLIQSPAFEANMDVLAIDTLAAGVAQGEITLGATTGFKKYGAEAANIYDGRDGWFLNEDTGEIKKIIDHDDTAAAAAGTFWFDTELDEAVGAAETVTVFPQIWRRVIVHPSPQTGVLVGIPLIDVTASVINSTQYFFWAQTWGIAPIDTATTGIAVAGDAIMPGATVDGEIDMIDAAALGPNIGYCLTTGVNAQHCLAVLMLWP